MLREDRKDLSDEVQDMQRAIDSLREELEAIDYYNQRADACKDDELRKILKHNADEEKEHASMLLEWIRRKDREMDKQLREFLFSDGSIVEKEKEEH